MEQDVNYYRRQIQGLIFILDDTVEGEHMISRDYMKKKLERILNGSMNFHPCINEALDRWENDS